MKTFIINGTEYKLTYAELGMLIVMCETVLTSKLSKHFKNKPAEQHGLLCHGFIKSVQNYTDYMIQDIAYDIYFQTDAPDRTLALNILI